MAAGSKTIYGVQPVKEALQSPKQVRRIYVARSGGKNVSEILKRAKKARVPVIELDKAALEQKVGATSHQGIAADLGGLEEELNLIDLLNDTEDRGETATVLILDGITDPQNVGAMFRSAYALGVHAVVVPERRSARMSPAVVRASAGAALHVPLVTVTNIKHAIEDCKTAGLMVFAAGLGGRAVFEADLSGPVALVMGSEDEGVRPSVLKYMDDSLTIPLSGDFDSLNVSAATAVLLYEVGRQRAGA